MNVMAELSRQEKREILRYQEFLAGLQLYQSGMSLVEAAEKVGCSADWLRRRLLAAGITCRSRGRRSTIPQDVVERALELYMMKLPWKVIMQRMSGQITCTQRTIQRLVSNLVEQRTGKPPFLRNELTREEMASYAVAMYQEGLSAAKVAQRLECSDSLVFSLLKESGVERRPYRNRPRRQA